LCLGPQCFFFVMEKSGSKSVIVCYAELLMPNSGVRIGEYYAK
jgi:hypothetical protein